MAGTIGARGNNGQGCRRRQLELERDAGPGVQRGRVRDASAIVAAFFYAVGKGARVVNASLGGPNFSQTMQDVINRFAGHAVRGIGRQ